MVVDVNIHQKPSDLNWELYIIIQLLREKKFYMLSKFDSIKTSLILLEEREYIKLLEDVPDNVSTSFQFEWRAKGNNLFKNFINFDEFWNIFPAKTEEGRDLRSANKEFRGKLTSEYVEAREKYLARVTDNSTHQEILRILTARCRQPLKYMNNIITYINKRQWEKDRSYLELNNDSMFEML